MPSSFAYAYWPGVNPQKTLLYLASEDMTCIMMYLRCVKVNTSCILPRIESQRPSKSAGRFSVVWNRKLDRSDVMFVSC
jgi:hypothetical protein